MIVSASAGSVMCHKASAKKAKVDGNITPGVIPPPSGNNGRSKANNSNSSIPIQKTGVDVVANEKERILVSILLPLFQAAMTPKTMPIAAEKSCETTSKATDHGNLWSNTDKTG